MKGLSGLLVAALALLFAASPSLSENKVVDVDVSLESITAFYWTYDASTYPPDFQRYVFSLEDDGYRFGHETRAGDHWPLTEADAVRSGSLALLEEEWAAFLDCLRGGTVKDRTPSFETDDGDSGPWLFLYWQGDDGRTQEFSFASPEAATAFEALCAALREACESAPAIP